MNPLIPGAWDIVWSLVWIAAIVFAAVALITLFRARAALGAAEATLWALGIIVIPVAGAFVWLFSSRRLRRTEALRRKSAGSVEAV